jgi:hypothetical protein
LLVALRQSNILSYPALQRGLVRVLESLELEEAAVPPAAGAQAPPPEPDPFSLSDEPPAKPKASPSPSPTPAHTPAQEAAFPFLLGCLITLNRAGVMARGFFNSLPAHLLDAARLEDRARSSAGASSGKAPASAAAAGLRGSPALRALGLPSVAAGAAATGKTPLLRGTPMLRGLGTQSADFLTELRRRYEGAVGL